MGLEKIALEMRHMNAKELLDYYTAEEIATRLIKMSEYADDMCDAITDAVGKLELLSNDLSEPIRAVLESVVADLKKVMEQQ